MPFKRTGFGSTHSLIRPQLQSRQYSTVKEQPEATPLRRSYLYVPASSERMLQKSLAIGSDVFIYDLEDSVAPTETGKVDARERLVEFLTARGTLTRSMSVADPLCTQKTPEDRLPHPSRIAVRVNSTHTPLFERDVVSILTLPAVRTLVLPKVTSVEDLETATDALEAFGRAKGTIHFVASIESALALHNVGTIAAWRSVYGPEKGGELRALLFGAEDFCADASVVRTPSRQELLYPRSKIAVTANAFGLEAIDMVCVNYNDSECLRDECSDGRRLGFTGKQAVHPSQIDVIQTTFVPTEQEEILRAAKIVDKMARAHAAQKGAVGLDVDNEKGNKEMIDAPMLKQAEKTIQMARAAGLPIPILS
ncbi:citrate lyase beta subunit [Russula earlei]|uniref:Citrate lyase beta subunit n=1 Tax=Russula earlei TaxID=71964 RepID=A0ACC0UDR3_9AGAM|nr:citrate lyase beta subunit [Russula earlei]